MQLFYIVMVGLFALGWWLERRYGRRSIWPTPMSQEWLMTHDHDARQLEWWKGLRRWRS